MMTKKIFVDRDCAKCRIFVAYSDSFLPKDSFAAMLNLLVKFHPRLSLNTTLIFADPTKNSTRKFNSTLIKLKIKKVLFTL